MRDTLSRLRTLRLSGAAVKRIVGGVSVMGIGRAFLCLLVGISGCVMLFGSREPCFMKRLVLTIAILIGLAAPAWAGFAEGLAAYNRGD